MTDFLQWVTTQICLVISYCILLPQYGIEGPTWETTKTRDQGRLKIKEENNVLQSRHPTDFLGLNELQEKIGRRHPQRKEKKED